MNASLNYVRNLTLGITSRLDSFVRGEEDFDRAKAAVPYVYYLLFFIAFARLEGLDQLAYLTGPLALRFPLFWAEGMSVSAVGQIAYIACALGALIACVFPYARAARLTAFLGLFTYHSFVSSFGGPNHQWDHWLWVLFILVFLPSVHGASQERRRVFSLIFWSAQAFLLLTYSMAGLDKLVHGFLQLSSGAANAFSIDAAALHTATELLAMGQTSLLGPFIIEHPLLGWFAFLGVIYLQFFSLTAALRPSLHRWWGIGLIVFHIGTLLVMRAVFTAPSALLLVLLVSSPFAPPGWPVRSLVRDLPLVPFIREAWKRVAPKIRPLFGTPA